MIRGRIRNILYFLVSEKSKFLKLFYSDYICMHAKCLQLCLNLCNPTDCSLSASSVHGILQARKLKWVAIPSFRGSSQPRDPTHVSYVSCTGSRFFTTSATWEALSLLQGCSNSSTSSEKWSLGLCWSTTRHRELSSTCNKLDCLFTQ